MTIAAPRTAGLICPAATCVFDLPAEGPSVGVARRMVRAYLRAHRHGDDILESASLVISELVTNAIRHAGGIRVTCSIRMRARAVRIEVGDDGAIEPRVEVRHGGVDECGGRGLLLVDALSADWGTYRRAADEEGPGTVVWAVVGAGDGHGWGGL
ncbi:ATP-binding protein [Streptomyces sp. NPDC051018]|uniref:ATP-binding protein n=1 Tax=Streptomyces sp. NPDC051018 TaxID=3365639 RepID=UPI00379E2E64